MNNVINKLKKQLKSVNSEIDTIKHILFKSETTLDKQDIWESLEYNKGRARGLEDAIEMLAKLDSDIDDILVGKE